MSDNTEQPGISLVFTDNEQNYYEIPAEIFERGRVPAERKAEIDEALREQEVSGYYLQVAAVAFVAGFVYTGAVLAVGAAGGAAVGAAVVGGAWAVSSASSR